MGDEMGGFKFDEKCLELAEHFLIDTPGATPGDYQELAAQIQNLCEIFCSVIEGDERGGNP